MPKSMRSRIGGNAQRGDVWRRLANAQIHMVISYVFHTPPPHTLLISQTSQKATKINAPLFAMDLQTILLSVMLPMAIRLTNVSHFLSGGNTFYVATISIVARYQRGGRRRLSSFILCIPLVRSSGEVCFRSYIASSISPNAY